MPPLFTCLWFTDPRARVCRPYAHSFAQIFIAIEVGTGCVREGRWSDAPGQANPAEGNPNSMPQIPASSKSAFEQLAGSRGTAAGAVRPSGRRRPTATGRDTILPASKISVMSAISQSPTYRAWLRLADKPLGSRLFSAAAMVRVPYFATVLPHVVHMAPGCAEVEVPKWFLLYNHLHTMHAIASCNAAEVAMGMAMEATVPSTHRWIPKAMTVQYLAKATTSLRAHAEFTPPDFRTVTDGVELVIPVSITDRAGTEVVHADITTWVTPAVSAVAHT